jgi:hypothetical protein
MEIETLFDEAHKKAPPRPQVQRDSFDPVLIYSTYARLNELKLAEGFKPRDNSLLSASAAGRAASRRRSG